MFFEINDSSEGQWINKFTLFYSTCVSVLSRTSVHHIKVEVRKKVISCSFNFIVIFFNYFQSILFDILFFFQFITKSLPKRSGKNYLLEKVT